eukprot:jgi/Ulvmu1/1018/UM104_0003.1
MPPGPPNSAPAASFLVWRATPAGCTVQQGTITLPKDGILLLAGHGAHFTGTTFSGGFLMCAGADLNGRFQHCTFCQCTLYAVHGACVHLHACTFDRGVPAVVASGAATAANFTSCVFHACQAAVVADRGANVAMRGCSIIGSTSAVVVNDPGSHAEVEEIHIMPAHSGPTVMDACGVMAGSGGGVRMHACEVRGIAYPVLGCASSVEVRSTRIKDYAYGVAAVMHATVAMRDVDMQNRPGFSPLAEALSMHGCTLRADKGRCAVMRDGAFVATDTQFEAGAPDMLCGAIDLLDSNVSMRQVRDERGEDTGFQHGVVATVDEGTGTAFMQLEGVSFHGCYYSVMGDGRVTAEVRRCRFAGCDVAGAREVMSEIARGSTDKDYPRGVSFVDADGGACRGQAVVVVEDCELAGPRAGVGVDEGGHATMRRCSFRLDGAPADMCRRGSRARMLDCNVHSAEQGVMMMQHSELEVQDCEFEGVRN